MGGLLVVGVLGSHIVVVESRGCPPASKVFMCDHVGAEKSCLHCEAKAILDAGNSDFILALKSRLDLPPLQPWQEDPTGVWDMGDMGISEWSEEVDGLVNYLCVGNRVFQILPALGLLMRLTGERTQEMISWVCEHVTDVEGQMVTLLLEYHRICEEVEAWQSLYLSGEFQDRDTHRVVIQSLLSADNLRSTVAALGLHPQFDTEGAEEILEELDELVSLHASELHVPGLYEQARCNSNMKFREEILPKDSTRSWWWDMFRECR